MDFQRFSDPRLLRGQKEGGIFCVRIIFLNMSEDVAVGERLSSDLLRGQTCNTLKVDVCYNHDRYSEILIDRKVGHGKIPFGSLELEKDKHTDRLKIR